MPKRLRKNRLVDEETRGWVRTLIRTEMVKRGLSYRDLAELLTASGIAENEGNLRSKVSRGELSASTLLNALNVMGSGTVDLDEIIHNSRGPVEDISLDAALRTPQVQVILRNDPAGLYEVKIGELPHPIRIALKWKTASAPVLYKMSHTIASADQPDAPDPFGLGKNPGDALYRALSTLIRGYLDSTHPRLVPARTWVEPTQGTLAT